LDYPRYRAIILKALDHPKLSSQSRTHHCHDIGGSPGPQAGSSCRGCHLQVHPISINDSDASRVASRSILLSSLGLYVPIYQRADGNSSPPLLPTSTLQLGKHFLPFSYLIPYTYDATPVAHSSVLSSLGFYMLTVSWIIQDTVLSYRKLSSQSRTHHCHDIGGTALRLEVPAGGVIFKFIKSLLTTRMRRGWLYLQFCFRLWDYTCPFTSETATHRHHRFISRRLPGVRCTSHNSILTDNQHSGHIPGSKCTVTWVPFPESPFNHSIR
jgi:hypothetical protein